MDSKRVYRAAVFFLTLAFLISAAPAQETKNSPVLEESGSGYSYPYDSFNYRDILRPLVNDRGQILIKEKMGVGNFVLQGMMDYPDGSRVVINGQILAEGDSFEGYTIKKIDVYKVILEKEGEEFVLKWEGEQ